MLYLFLLLGFYSNAQMSYFVEYNGSVKTDVTDLIPLKDFNLSNSISFGIMKKRIFFSVGVGREDWNIRYFHKSHSPSSIFVKHSSTYKFSTMAERQFLIPKTKLSIRLGVGGKFYFLNHLKDSFTYASDENFISGISASIFENEAPYWIESEYNRYSYITNMPFAILGNIAMQYSFKKWGIKFYYEPYLMRVRYKNPNVEPDKGATFIFFNDIGIGVNYQLNFKKKREKEK